MRVPQLIVAAALALGASHAAVANECANPDALGTSRVLSIDPWAYPQVGTIQYRDSLPLGDKEVVLTFDDGPMPPYTNRILETLAAECVKVNYFIIGRMARGYPDLLKQIHAEGHVIGTHSETHPLAFDKMQPSDVRAEIERGFASVRAALGNPAHVAPFFRIPGLLRAPSVEAYLRSRQMVTWSADITGDDWRHIAAADVVSRVMSRLDERGRGIILLHDIQPATALALPELLRRLKRGGYRIVQVAPLTEAAPAVAEAAKPAADSAPNLAISERAAAAQASVSPSAVASRASVSTEHARPYASALKPSLPIPTLAAKVALPPAAWPRVTGMMTR